MIPSIIKGFQYSEKINTEGLTTFNYKGPSNYKRYHTKYDSISLVEHYFTNQTAHNYVYTKTLSNSIPELTCVLLLSSEMTKNYEPSILDFIWLADNHALSLFQMDSDNDFMDRLTELNSQSSERNYDSQLSEKIMKSPPIEINLDSQSSLESVNPITHSKMFQKIVPELQEPKEPRKRGRPRKLVLQDPIQVTQKMFSNFVNSVSSSQNENNSSQEKIEEENNQAKIMISNDNSLQEPWSGGEIKNTPVFTPFH
jgi:hypothetical protein